MKRLQSVKDFIAKLERITWTTPDGDIAGSYTKELVSKGSNWMLTYSVQEMTSLHDKDVPFRAVIRLFFNGKLVTFWGCVDNEENAEWLIWFLRKKNAINDAINQEEKAAQKTGKDMWENL